MAMGVSWIWQRWGWVVDVHFLVQQIILIWFMGTFTYTSSLDPANHLRVVLGSRLSPAHCAHSPGVGS